MMANRPDLLRVGTGRLRSRWLPRHHPPQGRGRRGVRGGRDPHAGLKARRLLRRRIVGDLLSP
jgi:hypothetical protein